MKPEDLSFLESDYGVVVKGEIFDSRDPIVLSEDLLEIELPSGRTIDVGWYPEHDPQGKYRILLYRDHTGYPLGEFRTSDTRRVIEEIVAIVSSDSDDGVYATSTSMPETPEVNYG